MRSLIHTILLLSLFSCNLSDSTQEFSNGIKHIVEGGKFNAVIKDGEKGFFLEPNIELVKENESFILFVQSINSDFLTANIKEDFIYSSTKKSVTSSEIDSVIFSYPKLRKQMKYKRSFWILVKDKDSLVGPFSDFNRLKFFGF